MLAYGKELILDLHKCDPATFTRTSIAEYFRQLCELIDMEACDLHFWDDEGVSADECQTEPHLKGISAIQFIITSSVVIHTLDLLKSVYVNIFSCKDFDVNEVATFTRTWFRGRIVHEVKVDRL